MNLLLIPGINNTPATFAPMIAALPEGIACQPVDCPALPDVDAIAREILTRAPERFVVAGHSFGGYVALAILAQAPERVAGMVLVNSSTGADSPEAAAAREDRARQAEAGGYAALVEAATARSYHPRNAANAALMAERAQSVRDYGAERFAAHNRACAHRPDRTVLLRDSGKPVLVVAAADDQVIAAAAQEQMAKSLGARFTLIPEAGHMLPAEQPAALARAIADWLAPEAVRGRGAWGLGSR